MKLKELSDGMTEDLKLMVKSSEEKQTVKQSPYVIAEMTDGDSVAQIKFWGIDKSFFDERFSVGCVMNVPVNCKTYKDTLTYSACNGYGLLHEEEYDIHGFLILPPVDPEDIYQKCLDIISAMNEQHAMSKKLLSCIYSEHKYKEQLLIWSGAKSLHHNLRGGLIWHMYRMAELALLLPYRDICMNADKYENFMQKAYAKYPHDAQPTADFIARHSRIPATEEQLKEYIGNLDSENPYIKQLSRFQGTWPDIAKTLIACQIAEAVAKVYPTLDPCLMIAGILILSLNLEADHKSREIYSSGVLIGERMTKSKLISHDETEEEKCLQSIIMSADIGSSPSLHEKNLPEAFVISQIWKMADYSCADKQMLAAGCLIHDIGKLQELTTDLFGCANYTVSGSLFGHTLLGIHMVSRIIQELEIPGEIGDIYLHMIASHHGKTEWGALAEPAFPEAAIIHCLDMIDSRMYTYEKVTQQLETGSLSETIWGLGTKVYRAK